MRFYDKEFNEPEPEPVTMAEAIPLSIVCAPSSPSLSDDPFPRGDESARKVYANPSMFDVASSKSLERKGRQHEVDPDSMSHYSLSRRGITATEKTRAVRILQAKVRRWLVRREMNNIRKDRTLTMNRYNLVARLQTLPDSRSDVRALWGHLGLLVLYLIFMGLCIGSRERYRSGGFQKDTIWTYERGDALAGDDVRGFKDLYDFVENNIILLLNSRKSSVGQDVTYFNDQAKVIGPITISQLRSKTTDCTYSEENIWGEWNSGNCMKLGHETDPDLSAYGNDDGVDFSRIIQSFDTYYQQIVRMQPCPRFSAGPDNDFRMELTDDLSSTNKTALLAYSRECNYLDLQTRTVEIEMTILNGNQLPLVTFVDFTFEVDLSGHVSPGYRSSTFDVTSGYSSTYRSRAVLPFMTLLVLACVLGLLSTCCSAMINFQTRGFVYARYFFGYWGYHGFFTYLCIMIEVALFVVLKAKMDGLSDSKSINDFRREGSNLQDIHRVYLVFSGLASFLVVTKTLSYIKLRGLLAVLYQSVAKVITTMLHFLMTALIVFLGFCCFAYQVFGSGIQAYSSPEKAILSLFMVMLGEFGEWQLLQTHDELCAWVFFWVFNIVCTVVVMNFGIAIVLDGYTEVTQARRFQASIRTQIKEEFIRITEFQKHVVPVEMVVFVLKTDRVLRRQRNVTLFDLRARLPFQMSSEVLSCLYDSLRDTKVTEGLLDQVSMNPYRFVKTGRLHKTTNQHSTYTKLAYYYKCRQVFGCSSLPERFTWSGWWNRTLGRKSGGRAL